MVNKEEAVKTVTGCRECENSAYQRTDPCVCTVCTDDYQQIGTCAYDIFI
jgi:NADH pyrophosphatase NudC (nudix superfamily)